MEPNASSSIEVGSSSLRWTYARWIQVLKHWDLLGCDGRPSQGKLAACAALAYGCVAGDTVAVVVALCAAFGRRELRAAIGAWRGARAASPGDGA